MDIEKKLEMVNAPWCYLSVSQRISTLQRFILVHSIIYYVLDSSVITDKQFDYASRLLVKMQRENRKEFQKSDYRYVFCDFDGTTGFDLYSRLSEPDKAYLMKIARYVLSLDRKGGK